MCLCFDCLLLKCACCWSRMTRSYLLLAGKCSWVVVNDLVLSQTHKPRLLARRLWYRTDSWTWLTLSEISDSCFAIRSLVPIEEEGLRSGLCCLLASWRSPKIRKMCLLSVKLLLAVPTELVSSSASAEVPFRPWSLIRCYSLGG